MTGSQRLAAALAAGCSVAKPPEEAVMTTSRLVALLHRVGVPVDVVQLVLGAGETVGERLIDDQARRPDQPHRIGPDRSSSRRSSPGGGSRPHI